MPAREISYEQTAMVGVRDSLDPSLALPDRVSDLVNMYPLDPELGGGVVGRPGFSQLATGSSSLGSTYPQGIGEYVKRDGTRQTVAVAGAHLWTYDPATNAWTDQGVCAAASGPAAHLVNFNDLLIICVDGGTPRKWNGTTITTLTNAPGTWGRPAVYYAKLFLVKSNERSTIVWSEENQEDTGYEAGGYNNAWTLGQTDQSAIYALVGMNEALYVFRARSITAITGAVNADFKASGTREGVSESVGTISGGAIAVRDREIWFLDADGRPHVLDAGGGVTPLWKDAQEHLSLVDRSSLNVWARGAVSSTPTRLMLFLIPLTTDAFSTGTPGIKNIFVYDVGTRTFAGIWNWYHANATLGTIVDAQGVPRLLHASNLGWVYKHGNPDENLWEDQSFAPAPGGGATDGGIRPVSHVVVGPAWGYHVRTPKRFDRLDLGLVLLSNLHGLTIEFTTPDDLSDPFSVIGLESLFTLWDAFQWDAASWSLEQAERHVAIGLDSLGRWGRVTLRHSYGQEQLWLTTWGVQGYLEPAEVGVG